MLYAFVVTRVSVAAPLIVLIAWLAPAPIYFALVRYDVYPAAATLFALLATRRGSYVAGALWLGVAVALKGYALFVLPAYCAFILNRRGSFAAAQAGVLAILPMILRLAAVYAYAGWDGMTAPFRFYQVRGFNGESSYDALHYLFGVGLDAKDMAFVPAVLQIGCALLAAAMRPRSFSELADAMSFAILGFVSFSMFYSPQFVLWILPFIAFASSRVMAILGFLFAASTYAYFPVAFNMALGSQSYRPLLELTIVIVTALHFGMMGSALRRLYRAGRKRAAGEASAGI